jgi:putative aldouronate transport system substrate-binding protein
VHNHREKRWMIAVCVMLSISVLVSGCSKESGNRSNDAATRTKPSTEQPGDADQPEAHEARGRTIEITIANTFDPPKADGNYVQQYLEKKFNVTIKNIKFERNAWREQLNALLASGVIPDIFPGDAVDSDMVEWAKQGVIGSVSEEEIRQYMPGYVADFESVAPNAWIVGRYDGENWGVPRVWGNGATGFLPAYNGDWLDRIYRTARHTGTA